MAEIKSTLDLVLERTKHMVLDKAEKEVLDQTAYRKSINGLLQKYQDGLLTRERFSTELASLQTQYGVEDTGIVARTLVERLELAGDNTHWIELMKSVCAMDEARVSRIIRDYRERLEQATHRRRQAILDTLASTRGISGSAVAPNLAVDREWMETANRIGTEFKTALGNQTA